MKDISAAGLDFIARHEGLRLEAYKPTPNDVWTIGIGHTKGVYQGQTCTPVEAEQWLHDDLIPVMACINGHVTAVLMQCQFDSLCALLFNVGISSFLKSSALAALNKNIIGKFIEQAFSRDHGWTKQGGQILQGLVNRRAAEQRLFQNGDYGAIV